MNPTLTVHDEEKMFTHPCDLPVDLMQENGRGLFIVKSLAVSLKFRDIIGDGSKVSVVLPVKRKCDLQDLFKFADEAIA
jgi:anti-sigma regulatory factor (Ser/Thr protein kinase)